MKISEFIFKLEMLNVIQPQDAQEVHEMLGAACNVPYTEFKYMMRIHFRYNWKQVGEECITCLEKIMEHTLKEVEGLEITSLVELKEHIKAYE